jgi:hypothetical protein
MPKLETVRSALTPVLASAFPILSLYVANADEIAFTDVFLNPWTAVIVAGALLVFGLLRLVLRSATAASVLATAFVAVFFAYGISRSVADWVMPGPRTASSLANAIYAVIVAGFCVVLLAVVRRRPRLVVASDALLLVVASALVLAIVQHTYRGPFSRRCEIGASSSPVRVAATT